VRANGLIYVGKPWLNFLLLPGEIWSDLRPLQISLVVADEGSIPS